MNKKVQREQKTRAAKYFAKISALNKIIDKGGEEAKDAVAVKSNLVSQHERSSKALIEKKTKHKKHDALDSRMRMPGSYESGKRR